MGVHGDGPLQPHHPGEPGQEDLAGIPRRRAGRDRRLDAVLSARTTSTASAARACSTARSAACKRSTRSATAATARASCSTSSTTRRGHRCRRRRPRSKPTTSACSASNFGIVFNKLFTLANMPIQRFGSMLISKGEFDRYLDMLQHAHLDANLDGVMCRNLISVDWRGYRLRLRLQPDARPAAGAAAARDARASVRPARRRHRRQSDPRRRPLLRLHRRPGLELRRRAEEAAE